MRKVEVDFASCILGVWGWLIAITRPVGHTLKDDHDNSSSSLRRTAIKPRRGLRFSVPLLRFDMTGAKKSTATRSD